MTDPSKNLADVDPYKELTDAFEDLVDNAEVDEELLDKLAASLCDDE
jgi:hypothetical protein